MSKPVRLKLSRKPGFDLRWHSLSRNGRRAVNVARPSKWGNPFRVGLDGNRAACVRMHAILLGGLICCSTNVGTKAQEEYLVHARKNISKLRGKNLACWCHGSPCHGSPCHADILLDIANRETVR